MLRSDLSRKAHANFSEYFFLYAMCFSSTLTSNRHQFHVLFNHPNKHNADISGGARGNKFSPSLRLQPYFAFVSSDSFVDSHEPGISTKGIN